MAFGNNVTIVGNVTRDPELRFTNTGQALASFSVAVNRKWTNRQTNEQEERTSFIEVTCWAQLGENVAESIVKGTRVIVDGRLEQRTWDDKESGDKRSKVEIIADEVSPSLRWATATVTKNERRGDFDSGGGSGGGGGGSAPGPAEPPAGYNPDEEPF